LFGKQFVDEVGGVEPFLSLGEETGGSVGANPSDDSRVKVTASLET
jgi:hypothetical protein